MSVTRPLTILTAANSFDAVRFADHHLGRALSESGPVLYVDPPLSPMTPLREPPTRRRYMGPSLQTVAPGLYRYTPRALPGPERPGVATVTAAAMRRGIRRAAAAIGGSIGAHIATSVLLPVFDPFVERTSVFWLQDDFVGGASLMGVNAERNRRGEVAMITAADHVVAANPLLVDRCAELGVPATCIPFGCDIDNFIPATPAPPPVDVTLESPYAIVMGQLGDRIDRALLDAVAGRGVPLLLVGPFHDARAKASFEPLLARPNVQWIGPRPFEALPSYLAGAGVGLVPYTRSAFNQSSFPLKTLEYLASGLRVVATDLAALRWLGAPDVVIANAPGLFADAVTAVNTHGRTAGEVERRAAFAAQHSWERRAEQWAAVLGRAETREDLSCVS